VFVKFFGKYFNKKFEGSLFYITPKEAPLADNKLHNDYFPYNS